MSDIKEEQKRLYKRAEENDIKLLQEKIDSLESQLDFIGEQNKYIEKLESRINKAIDYIKEQTKGYQDDFERVEEESWLYDLKITLNILQGSDKE